MPKISAYTDEEKIKIDEDLFDIGDYINGLSQYIVQCPTPMTISIQGDWGSGKTSFMHMIKEQLNDEVHTVWLNTWQFSQFDLGDSLPILLLTQLAELLNAKEQTKMNVKKAMKIITMGSIRVLASGLTNAAGFDIKSATEKILEELPTETLTETVTNLKNHFQNSINECLKELGKDRVLILVDDLDRIHPLKAVELLEILKIFLNCDNCVFVLAIDYEVVVKGIIEKYGSILGEEKGRSFFDKIIQVPFKMPVAQYNIDKFVENTLKDMKIQVTDFRPYISLISHSVGYNPRSMKRLFNSFTLLRLVNNVEEGESELKERTLFAVLALQVSYESAYNYIANNIEDTIQEEFFQEVSDLELVENYISESQDNKNSIPSWTKEIDDIKDENRRYKICNFMDIFNKNVAENGNNYTQDDFERLLFAFRLASVTSVADSHDGKSGEGRGTRYDYTIDDEYKFYSLDRQIEKTNGKNGWNGAKIRSLKLLGQEAKARNFANALVTVLQILHSKNPEAFTTMREEVMQNLEDKGFRNLFVGGRKDGFAASNKIPGTNINIETKTNNNQKVATMRKIIEALGYKQSDLELELKLARR